ncbi:MAG: death-on-curing protein [Deltaproteobacteria bacterium CG11_big_fil_rev_8_21_14_0_20_49_13]|nr:MAG: death-on-curing protein [Deltaproteobacteria bacterium CG11_big_fil_rev_8_21_14_0_20_49_13]
MKNQIVIYQSRSGALELRADAVHDTFWLTQQHVAEIFDVQKAAISKHVKNIFDSGELEQKTTVSKMETVQAEGGRCVRRNIEYYNLDLVLSIGYRVNSIQATRFRQWATKTLKSHILNGYTLNRHRIQKNYAKFLEAAENIKQLLPAGTNIDVENVLELVSMFADTWLSLNAYDKDTLTVTGVTKKHVALTAEKLSASLLELKVALVKKGEATDLFGRERNTGSIAGIVGNVMQSFDDKELYETVEEKAAHLYFIVKSHPFTDGNKRSGAYAFVWFLRQARILDVSRMTPSALTALTILVAESSPKDKERVIKLVLMLIAKGRKKTK